MSTQQHTPILDLGAQLSGYRDPALAAITRVVDSQQFILGPEVDALEEELAASSLRLQPAEHLNRRLAIIVEQATKSGLEISGTRAGDVARGGDTRDGAV